MLIVTLVGLKKTGKTTSASALIREFKSRGLKVGGLKWMVHSTFTFDTPGKDTFRHKDAGADFVVSLSKDEMAYVQNLDERARLEDALRLAPQDTDILICEGLETDDPGILKMVVANSPDTLEETFEIRGLGEGKGVIALTGKISNETKEHALYPVYNCQDPKGVKELADLILERGRLL